MNFFELYEKVHNLPDFCRIYHEKVVHLKSDVHYCIPYYLKSLYQKASLEAYYLRKKKKMSTKISVVGGKMVLFGKLRLENETGQYVKLAEYQF